MKLSWCVRISAFMLACLPATGRLPAEQATKPKKQIVKPARNGVRVYSSSRVWIGVVDQDADVEILLESGEWCKVQYTKEGTRFVGWVLKEDLALPDKPPPEKKEEDTAPKMLSVQETSAQLRDLVRVPVGYKATTGLDPRGKIEMVLKLDGKGTQAKTVVLARFPRSPSVELYVENKIVEIKQFQRIAHPVFDRIINSYIRALEAYNESRIPDFKSLIERADSFWDVIDARAR